MTVREYITGKFTPFGISLSDADYADVSLRVDLDAVFSEDNRKDVYRQLAECVIPQLLIRPKSVSENGFEIQNCDVNALMQYYTWLCAEADIENKIGSSITDRTDIW